MNEKIKQLWEVSDEIKVRYPEQGSPVSVSAETLEKFAELIILECLANVWYTREDTVNGNISESIKDRIKQHFEIK